MQDRFKKRLLNNLIELRKAKTKDNLITRIVNKL